MAAQPAAPAPGSADGSDSVSEDLLKAVVAPSEPSDTEAACASRLAIGDWVAFRGSDTQEISLRACWNSRYGGLLLFADRPGEHARVLTRAQLARELGAGNARVLSNAALTDRAVAALLVRAAPGAPPAAGQMNAPTSAVVLPEPKPKPSPELRPVSAISDATPDLPPTALELVSLTPDGDAPADPGVEAIQPWSVVAAPKSRDALCA